MLICQPPFGQACVGRPTRTTGLRHTSAPPAICCPAAQRLISQAHFWLTLFHLRCLGPASAFSDRALGAFIFSTHQGNVFAVIDLLPVQPVPVPPSGTPPRIPEDPGRRQGSQGKRQALGCFPSPSFFSSHRNPTLRPKRKKSRYPGPLGAIIITRQHAFWLTSTSTSKLSNDQPPPAPFLPILLPLSLSDHSLLSLAQSFPNNAAGSPHLPLPRTRSSQPHRASPRISTLNPSPVLPHLVALLHHPPSPTTGTSHHGCSFSPSQHTAPGSGLHQGRNTPFFHDFDGDNDDNNNDDDTETEHSAFAGFTAC